MSTKKPEQIFFFGLNIEKKSTPYNLIGVVIILWLACWIAISNATYFISWSDRGQFGDMFGAVNALFSGLAFAGIIYTILLQQKELKETRDEFKQQNETSKKQRFENTFLLLVNLHRGLVERLVYFHGNLDTKNVGTSFFISLGGHIQSTVYSFDVMDDEKPDEVNPTRLVLLKKAYEQAMHTNRGFYNSYVSSLLQIIIYVLESDMLTNPEKDFYLSVATSSMDDVERKLLFYYHYLTFGGSGLNLMKLRAIEKRHRIIKEMCFNVSLYHPSHGVLFSTEVA